MTRIYVEADKTIELGKQGEYGVTEILFPAITDTVVILHQRNKDENPYSVTCNIRGDYVIWPVTATDTAHDGGGLCEVQYYTGSTLAKSIVFRTFVHWSVADSPTVTPSADQAWVQNVASKTAAAEAAKTAAEASAATATAKAAAAKAEADSLKAYPYDYEAELSRYYEPVDTSATTVSLLTNLYPWPMTHVDDDGNTVYTRDANGNVMYKINTDSTNSVKTYVFPVEAGQVYRVRKYHHGTVQKIGAEEGVKVNPDRFCVATLAAEPVAGAACISGKANYSMAEIYIQIPEGAHYMAAYIYYPVKNGGSVVVDWETVAKPAFKTWRVTLGKRSSMEVYPYYPDGQCYSAFISAMNDTAKRIGMEHSYFHSASGLTRMSVTTPADLARLALACAASPAVMDWCGTTDIVANIYGVNARAYKDDFGNDQQNIAIHKDNDPRYQDYAMLKAMFTPTGGKGGSIGWWVSDDRSRWGQAYDPELDHDHMKFFKNFVYFFDIGGKMAVSVACVTENGVYNENPPKWIHPLFDTYASNTAAEAAMLLEYRLGYRDAPPAMTHAQAVLEAGGGYVAFVLPTESHGYKCNFSVTQMFEALPIVADGETIITMPASVSKMLTALVAADYREYFHRRLIVHFSDLQGGSGGKFSEGDEFRFDDAMRIMLMKSSNTLAHTIGREVGLAILTGKNQPAEYDEDTESDNRETTDSAGEAGEPR